MFQKSGAVKTKRLKSLLRENNIGINTNNLELSF